MVTLLIVLLLLLLFNTIIITIIVIIFIKETVFHVKKCAQRSFAFTERIRSSEFSMSLEALHEDIDDLFFRDEFPKASAGCFIRIFKGPATSVRGLAEVHPHHGRGVDCR